MPAKQRSTWGSIRKKPNGRYEIRYTTSGKQRSTVVHGTKRDAERKLAELRVKYDTGSDDADSFTSIGAFAESVFFPECERRVEDGSMSKTTFKSYKQHYESSIKEPLGDTPLNELKARHVQSWLDGMTKGKASKAKSVLHNIMSRAVTLEYIDSHPVGRRYIMPSKTLPSKRTTDIYHADELNEIFEECRGEFWEPCFIMGAFGGGQRAEVLGSKPSEVEFVKADGSTFALVPIKRGVHLIDGEVVVENHAKNELRESQLIIEEPYSIRLEEIVEELIEDGSEWFVDDGFGSPCNPEAMTRAYKKWLSESSHRFIPFSNLRNSYSTMLHARGYSDDLVKKLMRHSSASKVDYLHYNRPNVDDLISGMLNSAYLRDSKGQSSLRNEKGQSI